MNISTRKQTEGLKKFSRTVAICNTPSFAEKLPNALGIVKKAKREIVICSGEFSPRYYDHPTMLLTFNEKLGEDVDIWISAGPCIAVADEHDATLEEFKKTWQSHKENNIKFDDLAGIFIKIRPVFKFFFFGHPETKKKMRLFITFFRDEMNHISVDRESSIRYIQPFMQQESKEVWMDEGEPGVEQIVDEFMNELIVKKEITSAEEFFTFYTEDHIETRTTLQNQTKLIVAQEVLGASANHEELSKETGLDHKEIDKQLKKINRRREWQIVYALEQPGTLGRSINELANDFKISPTKVEELLEKVEDLAAFPKEFEVGARADDEDLYTTKSYYLRKASFPRRLLSAITNEMC